MKKHFLLLLIPLLVIGASNSRAAISGVGGNTPREYLVDKFSMPSWSFGGYMQDEKREFRIDGGSSRHKLKIRHAVGFIGYAPLSWFTIYAGGGGAQVTDPHTEDDGDNGSEAICKVDVRIFNYDISDTTFAVDELRINFGAQYSDVSTEYHGSDLKWEEWFLSITASLVVHSDRGQLYFPRSTTLFAGPIVSDVNGMLGMSSIKEDDRSGVAFGLEFYIGQHVSLQWEMQSLDNRSQALGLNFQF